MTKTISLLLLTLLVSACSITPATTTRVWKLTHHNHEANATPILATPEGTYFLTAAHAVCDDPTASILLTHHSRGFLAELVATNEPATLDLAILFVPGEQFQTTPIRATPYPNHGLILEAAWFDDFIWVNEGYYSAPDKYSALNAQGYSGGAILTQTGHLLGIISGYYNVRNHAAMAPIFPNLDWLQEHIPDLR